MKKSLYIISLFLILSITACDTNKSTSKSVGQSNISSDTVEGWGDAPDFTLPTADDKPYNLSSNLGKVIIVDFWATWCPPCRKGIPEFVELYNQYKEKGLEIVGVSLDKDGAGVVVPFMKDYGINYPIVLGDNNITLRYGGIRGIPTAFIIDKAGNIVNKFVGYRPKQVFEDEIKKLL